MGSGKFNTNQCRGKYRHGRYRRSGSSKSTTPDDATVPSQCSTALEGCRIINIAQLKEFMEQISKHSSSCKEEVTLVGESRDGLASILKAQCTSCNMTIDFPTSSKVAGPTGNRRWECNLSAVWGQMAIGGGYNHLQESMAALGVPIMTKKSFVNTEKTIGKWWWDCMEKSCNEAAVEERKLAIEKGSFHEGVPAITVIIDGGWSN